MVLYYIGPCARITHEVFEVHCPSRRVFRLENLTRPGVIEESAEAAAFTSVRSGSSSMAGAAAVVLLLQLHDRSLQDSPLLALGLLAVVVAALVVRGACVRLAPVQHSLVALYRGRAETLYRTTDVREFGQVTRGLIRAMEHRQDSR
jgi:hypothetical protein